MTHMQDIYRTQYLWEHKIYVEYNTAQYNMILI